MNNYLHVCNIYNTFRLGITYERDFNIFYLMITKIFPMIFIIYNLCIRFDYLTHKELMIILELTYHLNENQQEFEKYFR